ncbi:MAG: PEPxxWA-CTERM sorting domain-containing protein [Sphingomonadales bacterium]|nr:PEPxxWA-CTERM sorting domain-containing protein [Sphingomonadales bacterium]
MAALRLFDGVLSQAEIEELNRVPFVVSPPAVPEPATWAMMIGGLALVGAAMRARRASVSFA